jgi:hypothetical protein
VRSTVAVSTKVDRVSRTTLKDILLFVLAYLLWLASIVACSVAVVEFRSTINVLWLMTGHSRWTLGLVDQLSVLSGGLVAFVYVVFLESYYRRGVTQQSKKPETGNDVSSPSRVSQRLNNLALYVLLRRFAWTMAIPIGLLVASLAMRQVALRLPY